jgi:TonB family protein
MKLQQSRKRAAVFVFCLGISIAAQAQHIPVEFGSAIDAHGIKHIARGPEGPSFADLIYAPKPEYPYSERARHNEGTAVVRMDIDLKTGNTTYVTLIRSSGFPNLDEVAIRALARWRFKPGKWKEAEVPVTFTMSRPGR